MNTLEEIIDRRKYGKVDQQDPESKIQADIADIISGIKKDRGQPEYVKLQQLGEQLMDYAGINAQITNLDEFLNNVQSLGKLVGKISKETKNNGLLKETSGFFGSITTTLPGEPGMVDPIRRFEPANSLKDRMHPAIQKNESDLQQVYNAYQQGIIDSLTQKFKYKGIFSDP